MLRERAEGLGADFGVRFANCCRDVACFDDPCLFSVLFHPCVSRLLAGQKRGHMMVNMVICFVENRCSLGPPRCSEGMTMHGVRVHAVQLVSVVVLVVILAQSLAWATSLYSNVFVF